MFIMVCGSFLSQSLSCLKTVCNGLCSIREARMAFVLSTVKGMRDRLLDNRKRLITKGTANRGAMAQKMLMPQLLIARISQCLDKEPNVESMASRTVTGIKKKIIVGSWSRE